MWGNSLLLRWLDIRVAMLLPLVIILEVLLILFIIHSGFIYVFYRLVKYGGALRDLAL